MDYIAQDPPLAALELDELIELKVEQLLERPQLYRAGRKRGTWEMVVHPHYIVIYRMSQDLVEILRVKHSARQWP